MQYRGSATGGGGGGGGNYLPKVFSLLIFVVSSEVGHVGGW